MVKTMLTKTMVIFPFSGYDESSDQRRSRKEIFWQVVDLCRKPGEHADPNPVIVLNRDTERRGQAEDFLEDHRHHSLDILRVWSVDTCQMWLAGWGYILDEYFYKYVRHFKDVNIDPKKDVKLLDFDRPEVPDTLMKELDFSKPAVYTQARGSRWLIYDHTPKRFYDIRYDIRKNENECKAYSVEYLNYVHGVDWSPMIDFIACRISKESCHGQLLVHVDWERLSKQEKEEFEEALKDVVRKNKLPPFEDCPDRKEDINDTLQSIIIQEEDAGWLMKVVHERKYFIRKSRHGLRLYSFEKRNCGRVVLLPGDIEDIEQPSRDSSFFDELGYFIQSRDHDIVIGDFEATERYVAKELIDTYGTTQLLANWFPDVSKHIKLKRIHRSRSEFSNISVPVLDVLLNYRKFAYEQTLNILIRSLDLEKAAKTSDDPVWTHTVGRIKLGNLRDDREFRKYRGCVDQIERTERMLKLLWREINEPKPGKLFSMDLSFQTDLDNEDLSNPQLREEFENNNIQLSRSAIVWTEEENKKWMVDCRRGSLRYIIKKEGDSLNIYPEGKEYKDHMRDYHDLDKKSTDIREAAMITIRNLLEAWIKP